MKKWMLCTVAILMFAGLSAFTVITLLQWNIQEGHVIQFNTAHVKGAFTALSGTLVFDKDNLAASTLEAIVPVNSISTGIGLKDKHARGKKWFDAAQYPFITFTSTQVRGTVQGYEADGNLTMHGVTKPLTIPFTFSETAEGGALFTGSFKVNRTDFNIGKPGGKVGEVIAVTVSVPVKRQ